ncbi:MAG: acylphosphatase [Alphaproteobacteria bacterium]|nr:acylphosphatase [Alphaproteobacteria bacterium]
MAGEADRTAVRVRVSGHVQGVWFRAWTGDRAREVGLDGWVRNRADGTVEALFAGPAAAVARMVEACRDGPPAARVEDVVSEAVGETVAPGSGFVERASE